MSTPDTKFSLILQDGREYRTGDGGAVTGWWIESDYLVATDGWTASFQSKTKEDRDLLPMAPCELLVDGRSRLVGRVDGRKVGHNGREVALRGRDYIADLTQNGIDPTVHVKAGDKLDQALLLAFRPNGIMGLEDPEVKLARRTGKSPKPMPKLIAADLKQTKIHPGDGSYEWGNRIVARHGYTIQPATVRNKICLEEPNYLQAPLMKIIRKDDPQAGGNVVESFADEDYSTVPTFATMVGGAGVASERLGISKYDWDVWVVMKAMPPELQRIFNRWTVGGRRLPKSAEPLVASQLYRFLYFEDKHAKTLGQIAVAAWRTVCEELKKTLSYEVTLRGTFDPVTGYSYATNTIVTVDDDLADVHEDLWVASCGMGVSGKDGIVTKLKCWRPWSFNIGKGGHGDG